MARITTTRRPRLRVTRQAQDSLAIADFQAEVEAWIAEGKRSSCSPSTLDQRRRILGGLMRYLERDGYVRLGAAQVASYLDHLTGRGLKPSTLACYHGYLRAFCGWLIEQDVLTENLMAKLRRPRVREDQIRPFTSEQVAAMCAAAKRTRDPVRDEALFLLLYDTGIRVSELCGLNLGDVDLAHRRCTVLGKGNKRRTVYFADVTRRALRRLSDEYHDPHDAHRGQGDAQPLFCSNAGKTTGERISRSGVQRLIARLGRDAHVTGVRCSPHTLRHTFAVEFLRQGGQVFALQLLMGHISLTVTRRYVNLAQADLAAQHQLASPADNLFGRRRKK